MSPRATPRIVLVALATAVVLGCGPRIEDDPVPEHRIEPCETWCEMLMDPGCPFEIRPETDEECVEGCTTQELTWVPIDEDEDACVETYVPFIECMASLSCEEALQHFERMNEVPVEEQSACGERLGAQLECQSGGER